MKFIARCYGRNNMNRMSLKIFFYFFIFSVSLSAKEKDFETEFYGKSETVKKNNVLLGIDVLKNEDFEVLRGKKIGLITNQSGINRRGKSSIDILYQTEKTHLTALFSPEHGIRGEKKHGEIIADAKDGKTGLPVYSLYGTSKRPSPEMLRGLDALIFDLQDVGARFFTYITTLAYAIEEAAKNNIEIYVLDRPNPITGTMVEGEILSSEVSHFTAYLEIPVRHGMTVGEIAKWYNQTSDINAKLTVIEMKGWDRSMWMDETGLNFIAPSPNIRNLKAAILYPGIGGLEATNVSVGRGTKTPFEIFGAPWMDGKLMAEKLNFFNIAGFQFDDVKFTPQDDVYMNQPCHGVKITITDRNAARPVDLFTYLIVILMDLYPNEFIVRWDEMERITGSKEFKQFIEMKQSAEAINIILHDKAKKFEESRKPYLLY